MRKYCIYIIVFVAVVINNSYAQNNIIINNLEEKLKNETVDTTIINTLNDLSWEYRKTDFSLAIEYASQAISFSDSIHFYNGKTVGLNRLGATYIYQKNYTKAKDIYLEVLEREESIDNTYGIGRAQNQLGEIHKNIGDLVLALNYTEKSFKNFKTLDKENVIAIVTSNLGAIHTKMGAYDLAIKAYQNSLNIRKKTNDKKGVATTLLGLSTLYIKLEDYTKAIESLIESEAIFTYYDDNYELAEVYNNLGICFYELNESEKALSYYKKAQALKDTFGLTNKDASTFNNIGGLYHRKGNLDLALFYYRKSYNIDGDIASKLSSTTNIADIYYSTSNYHEALDFYHNALSIAENTNHKINQVKIFNDLSLCYSALKKYEEALFYNDCYIILKKELESSYRENVITARQYEEANNNNKIAQISLEKLKAQEQQKKIIIISLIAGLILALLLFYTILKIRKHKEKIRLKNKEVEIQKKEIDGFLKDQEINAMNLMIGLQEKERKRISEDLHDRIGSILSTVKIYFKSVEESIENLQKENLLQYKKANDLLDDACIQVRKISHDLGSGLLMKIGLVTTLENLRNTLEASKQIKVNLITHGMSNRLENNIELGIYRAIQELVSNVLKHSRAKELTIQLIKDNGLLNIIVEDDGIGFDISKEENKAEGIGFINIRSRIEALNGELNIDSMLKKGTTVSINIPI